MHWLSIVCQAYSYWLLLGIPHVILIIYPRNRHYLLYSFYRMEKEGKREREGERKRERERYSPTDPGVWTLICSLFERIPFLKELAIWWEKTSLNQTCLGGSCYVYCLPLVFPALSFLLYKCLLKLLQSGFSGNPTISHHVRLSASAFIYFPSSSK